MSDAPADAARKTPATPRDLRNASAAAVLAALWRPEPMTGTDVMLETGLTRATVHDVCADLIALGWVLELDDQRVHGGYRRGRPARRYGLRARVGVVVGVEAGTARCTALVTDLLGRPVGRGEQPAPPDPAHRREAAAAAVRQALASAGATTADVLACTVALPVPIAAAGGLEVLGNPFWTLMHAGLADHLADLLPCAVTLVNDADAAAVAEGRLGAAAGVDQHVTLLLDAGFGAGIVAGGSPVRGRWGRGGEMRWVGLVSEVGASIGLGPLLAHWAERGVEAPPPTAADNDAVRGSLALEANLRSAQQVLTAAADGDGPARAITRRVGRHVAAVVATAAGLLDPEVVVLSGRLAPHLDPVVAVVEQLLPEHLDAPLPRLVTSGLGPDVAALGAVQGALDDVRRQALDLRSALPAGAPAGT